MKKTNLINILKTLSKDEMKILGKFVSSPFHNNGKNCTPLFKQLQKFHPEFESPVLNKEILYKKLYPGKKFNKQILWNLTSSMEKMAKDFLAHNSLRKNKIKKNELLILELGKRKLLNDYQKILADMELTIETSGIDYDYLENKVHLETFRQGFYHSTDRIKEMSNSKMKASEYQILIFLRMTVGGLNDTKLLANDYNYKFDINIPLSFANNLNLKNIVDYAYINNYEYAFLIEIYYRALMTIITPEDSIHLDKLKELFTRHFDKFNVSEKRTIMHWIVNYCLDKSGPGDAKYKRIVFEINNLRLKEGLAFYPENQIPRAIYLQILNSALLVEEIKWAENFIKNYTIYLQKSIRSTTEYLAQATLFFHTKEYAKVLDSLNKVEFVDIGDKFTTRKLILRSYYELNEFESLINYLDSSQRFIAKNPMVSEVSRIYLRNFYKYLKKIAFIRENKDFDKVYTLKNEIAKTLEVSNKSWLLEKIEELENEK